MIRSAICLGIALCLAGTRAYSSDHPIVLIADGFKVTPQVQFELKIVEFKKGHGEHSILRGLCEDSPLGYAVLGPHAQSEALREMLADTKVRTTSYPRMVSVWDRECQVRSVVNQPVLSGSKVNYVPIGTIMSVTANSASDQGIRCHWDIASSVLTGFQDPQHPIIAKAQHVAETVLKPGECIAVFNEPRGKGEDGMLFLLTPKRFVN